MKKKYQTRDFYLAVWFLMNGIELEIKDIGKERVTFLCDDFQDRDILISGFYNSDLLQKFIISIKSLKNKMYSKRPPVIFNKEKQ